MFKPNQFVLGSEWPGCYRYISFGAGKSSADTKRISVWNKPQKQLANRLFPQLESGLSQPVPRYPGQMYVPTTGTEQTWLNTVPQLATDLASMRGRLGQPAYEITPEATENFYQQSIVAPTMREWEKTTRPTIKEAYSGPGYWGSARANEESDAAQNLAISLGAKRGELGYADEMARREALTGAANREATYGAPMVAQQSEMLGSAGAYTRMIEQEKAKTDIMRWLQGEAVDGVEPTQYNPYIQYVFEALGLAPFALGTQASSWNLTGGVKMT